MNEDWDEGVIGRYKVIVWVDSYGASALDIESDIEYKLSDLSVNAMVSEVYISYAED